LTFLALPGGVFLEEVLFSFPCSHSWFTQTNRKGTDMSAVLCSFLKQKKWTFFNELFFSEVMFKGLAAVETMKTFALFDQMTQTSA